MKRTTHWGAALGGLVVLGMSGTSSGDTAPAGDKSGVSTQAIALPQGAGKVEGVGESFSTQLSTGVFTYQVPVALPMGRGEAQPSLALQYNSAGGNGVAGVGWELTTASIARETDKGTPRYQDPAFGKDPEPTQDRFALNGASLVPLCTVRGGKCPAMADERMPAWANGWMYFRPRIEGAFERIFWSPDRQSWRVQRKTGVTLEFGVPRDESGDTNALETNPDAPRQIFRWNLARAYDVELDDGEDKSDVVFPRNVAAYRYQAKDGRSYLSDIFYTPPAANAGTAPLSSYAHHVRLVYTARPDARTSYRRGYASKEGLRLTRIDVASPRSSDGGTGSRELVRRYHLAYEAGSHRSLLSSVQMEGRCEAATLETSNQALPDATACPRLPPLTLGYSHVTGRTVQGAPAASQVEGWEPVDARVNAVSGAPALTFDSSAVELFDANSDGLPDVLVTRPELYAGGYGLYLNGAGGKVASLSETRMTVVPVLGATAATLGLANPNVSPADVDGDGKVDLVHMPDSRLYAVYRAEARGAGWAWVGRTVNVSSQQNPQLDLGRDAVDSRVADVDGDGLVDVLVTKENALRTFFSLGRFPGGDGQFGQGKWTGADTATLSTEPVRGCLPLDNAAVRLSDPDVALADMNGDGLTDLVRVKSGVIQYWPGRGNGIFGTGTIPACAGGGTLDRRGVRMAGAPFADATLGDGLHLDDVNGDGLDDLVSTRGDVVQIWINEDGVGFNFEPHRLEGAPATLAGARNVRFADMNGSGTRDLVWGDASGYRFIDPAGGIQPWLLTSVDNGLGKVTEVTFGSSMGVAAEAAQAGTPWSTSAPVNTQVVKRVVERNRLGVAGRTPEALSTTYGYRDPIYDGREREFRGFREVSVRREGDVSSPSSTTRTRFLLGECVDETRDSVADCEPAGRYRDNVREALKGLPASEESFDEEGRFLGTSHTTYALRQLASGTDGRVVRHAYARRTDSYLYDVASFRLEPSTLDVVDVEMDLPPQSGAAPPVSGSIALRSRQGRVHLRQDTELDRFGNATRATAFGCMDGCASPDEAIAHVQEPLLLPHGSGWLWRVAADRVEGSLSGSRKETRTEYDARGHAVVTRALLSGSGILDRFHESGAAVAPTPVMAAVDGLIVVAAQDYDGFGHVTFRRSAENRCARVAYDAAYATYPATETVYAGTVGADAGGAASLASKAFAATRAGNGCGGRALTSTATYDRGLGGVTDTVGLHGERTKIVYDGLGRLSALWKPHPYTVGAIASRPSLTVEYLLPTDPKVAPFSRVHTRTEDGPTVEDTSVRESWAYVDGWGRTVASLEQADPSSGDGGDWVVTGLTRYDAKAAVAEVFQPWFWSGDGAAFPLASVPATTSSRHGYDAFGRQSEVYGFDGRIRSKVVHHALSDDAWDKAQLMDPLRKGAFSTAVRDGHGRAVARLQRRHVDGNLEVLATRTTLLSTGEPVRIARQVEGAPATAVSRWMAYDSLGRMVLNVEPNTSKGYVDGPGAAPANLKAWRYAYDEAGELVGTSDARGCGVNLFYDAAGRTVAKDYSPCTAGQAAYSAPDLSTGDGTEVFYRYDAPDSDVAPACPQDPALLLGRVASISDRGSKAIMRTDGRGRVACLARKVARPTKPTDATSQIASRYASEWFVQQTTYDAADRPARETTGATALLSAGGDSYVRTLYSKRGTIKAICASYGQVRAPSPEDRAVCNGLDEVPLVRALRRAANGRPESVAYGDLAATTTTFGYDLLERLADVRTDRVAPSAWAESSSTFPTPADPAEPTRQTVLEDIHVGYDDADNPLGIRDDRDPASWPRGAKPVSRTFAYDDYYRLTSVTYDHGATADEWVSPFDAENRASGSVAPRVPAPSPHVLFSGRTKEQTFRYDAVGNIVQSTDDARGFFDRSLGNQTHGSSNDAPYQLRHASNRGEDAPGAHDGDLSARYDAAGNLTAMDVVRDGPCLPTGTSCGQHFAYEWDEVGHLARARRWDASKAVDEQTEPAAAELRYAYDASDTRVLKTALDRDGNERHAVYALRGVELRDATFRDDSYEHTATTEIAYLFANGVRLARVIGNLEALPRSTNADVHVLLELPDHLGSSSVVLDLGTAELVERSTYQAYGAADADYRPARWAASREDYRFTGKEEDVELGLQYFGKRYYAPALNRWISADPLAVHEPGAADLNVYAYVHGRVLVAIDLTGLAATGVFRPDLSDDFFRGVHKLAAELGASPRDLLALMYFESGGVHPEMRNGQGSGGAGLVQIMPDNAAVLLNKKMPDKATMGEAEYKAEVKRIRTEAAAEIASLSATAQLAYVRRYLNWGWDFVRRANVPAEEKSAFKFDTPGKLYLIVTTPKFLKDYAEKEHAMKAAGKTFDPDDVVFAERDSADKKSAQIYRDNPLWDENRDGRATAKDIGKVIESQYDLPEFKKLEDRLNAVAPQPSAGATSP